MCNNILLTVSFATNDWLASFIVRAISHHHHFAPGMCFLLFLEPSRGSPHAGVSWFLQRSCHLSRSWASNLCKSLAVMSHSSTSFHLFFGLRIFVPSTSKSSAFTGPLFHPFSPHVPTIATFSLSETLPISLHPSFPKSSHCSFYLSRFSHISFATFLFLWSSASFHLLFSMPNIQHHKLEHFSHSFWIRCL